MNAWSGDHKAAKADGFFLLGEGINPIGRRAFECLRLIGYSWYRSIHGATTSGRETTEMSVRGKLWKFIIHD
jgi:hypothetical protein